MSARVSAGEPGHARPRPAPRARALDAYAPVGAPLDASDAAPVADRDATADEERRVAGRTSPSPATLLRIYLNDHRAGAVAGVALCRRMARRHDGTAVGRDLIAMATEISEDRSTLEAFAHVRGIRSNPIKALGSAVLERCSRLKLNGTFVRRSPLSSLIEVESLLAGVDAKRSLWHSLRSAGVTDLDLDELLDRADRQRERLLAHHDAAALVAFGREGAVVRE